MKIPSFWEKVKQIIQTIECIERVYFYERNDRTTFSLTISKEDIDLSEKKPIIIPQQIADKMLAQLREKTLQEPTKKTVLPCCTELSQKVFRKKPCAENLCFYFPYFFEDELFGFFVFCGNEYLEKNTENILEFIFDAVEKHLQNSIQNQENKTINNITNIITTTLLFEEISQRIVDTIVNDLQVAGGVFFLVKDDGYVYPWTVSSTTKIFNAIRFLGFPEKIRDYRNPLSEKRNLITTSAAEQREIFGTKLTDFFCPPLPTSATTVVQKSLGFGSFLAVPIIITGKTKGVIILANNNPIFSSREKRLIRIFAAQVAIAFENAQLFEKTQAQVSQLQTQNTTLERKTADLKRLQAASRTISSSVDFAEVAQTIVDLIAQVTFSGTTPDIAIAVLYLYDSQTETFRLYKLSNNDKTRQLKNTYKKPYEHRTISIHTPSGLQKLYWTHQPVTTHTLAQAIGDNAINIDKTQPFYSTWGIKSHLILPLKSPKTNTIIGAIHVSTTHPKDSIPQDLLDNLESFAAQAAISLENAHARDQIENQITELQEKNTALKRKTRDLKRLQGTLRTISSTLDFRQTAQNIVDIIAEVPLASSRSEIAIATLYLYNQETHSFHFFTISDNEKTSQLRKIYENPFEHRTISLSSKTPALLKEVYKKKHLLFAHSLIEVIGPDAINADKTDEYHQHWGTKCHIVLPLKSSIGTIVGALHCSTIFEQKAIPTDLLDNLESFANQAAIALENTRLFEQVQSHYEELEKQYQDIITLQKIANHIASTLNFREIAQKIVDAIQEDLGEKRNYLGGLITFRDREENLFRPYALSQELRKQMTAREANYIDTIGINITDHSPNACLSLRSISEKRFFLSESMSSMFSPLLDNKTITTFQKRLGIATIFVFPLLMANEVVGTIHFFLNIPTDDIKERKIKIMQAFADQISIALHNVTIYSDLERAFEKLQKIDHAKMEFVAMAGHQLRTPLTSIRSYVSLLGDETYGKMPEKSLTAIENVQKNIDRLAITIEDILSVSHLETGKLILNKDIYDIDTIIHEVIELLQPSARKAKITLSYTPPKQTPLNVPCDKQKFTQVLINLIDNAIQYTPQKGSITLTAQTTKQKALITIADTGIGIPTEYLDGLFDKFTRAENAKAIRPDGSGVGMYLVHHVIEAHHGTITVKSKVNKGTTFTIALPLS